MTSFAPRGTRKVWSVIRPDDDGTPDDIVISGDLFRMERMDDGFWWLAIYRNGKRTSFHLYTKRNAKIAALVVEDELGCHDD